MFTPFAVISPHPVRGLRFANELELAWLFKPFLFKPLLMVHSFLPESASLDRTPED